MKKSISLNYLTKFANKSKLALFFICTLVFISNCLALSVPVAIKGIFDTLGTSKPDNRVLIFAFICLFLMAIKYVLDYYYKSLAAAKTSKMFSEMVNELYEHMLLLGMDFYIGTKSGEFMQSFDQDMYVIVRMVMNDFLSLFASIIQVILMLGFLTYLNPVLMIISLAFVPLYYMLKKATDGKAKIANDNMVKKWRDASSNIHENLSGIKAIKEANAEKYCARKNREYSEHVAEAFCSLEKQTAKTSAVTSMFNQVVPFIVMLIGILFYKENGLTTGSIFAFFYVIVGFFSPLGTIVIQSNSIQKGKVSIERVTKYLDVTSNVMEKKDALSIGKLIGNISLKNVNFRYNDKNAIRNVNLEIKNGESVAIVGPSGAGKSTLLSLIFRLYDPQEGVVKIDDHDVKDYIISDLRKQIGYVGQETVLFHTTIKENLLISNRDASTDEIHNACKLAGIHNAITQKELKYETVIGENGMKLSGGQRQRIALARMILKSPSIVLFDESFSNIDSESEYAFFENIKDVFRGKTIIIISHRLSSVMDADKIAYMENGNIQEINNHENLMRNNKRYQDLWKNQALVN